MPSTSLFLLTVAITFTVGEGSIHDVLFTKLGTFDRDDRFDVTYYLPRHFTLSWQNVQSICQSFGMEFLTLETEAEANNFLQLCKENERHLSSFTHVGGVTTEGKSMEKWFWVDSGKIVDYPLKWSPGEPNNGHGGSEFCLSIVKRPDGFYFNDVRCNGEVLKFICQLKNFRKVAK